jgi:hypothetical protein
MVTRFPARAESEVMGEVGAGVIPGESDRNSMCTQTQAGYIYWGRRTPRANVWIRSHREDRLDRLLPAPLRGIRFGYSPR